VFLYSSQCSADPLYTGFSRDRQRGQRRVEEGQTSTPQPNPRVQSKVKNPGREEKEREGKRGRDGGA